MAVNFNLFSQINFSSQLNIVYGIKNVVNKPINTPWAVTLQQQDPARAHAHIPGTVGATVQRNTKQQ